MSKMFWKFVVIGPAVLLASMLVSAGAVRAAQGEGHKATETQATTIETPLQTAAEAPIAEAQPAAKPAAAKPVIAVAPVAPATETAQNAAPVAPAALNAPVFSTNYAPADVKSPAQVAVNSSQPVVAPEASPAVEMSQSVSVPAMSAAKPTTAEATGAANSPAAAPSESREAVPAMPPANPTIAQSTPAANSAADTASDSRSLEQINRYSREGSNENSIGQVTNVSQFSDVRPGDWAYEALRELVERYGCIAGYPDSTYRGNRAMTRYEFAAGLNACLKQLETKITAGLSEYATREDLEKLRRLIQEFQAELATLGTRVDRLEGRVGFLESHQFSTTTKLVGEAIFAVTSPIRNRGINANDKNTVFGDRVRLELQSSFTGRDILHTRLAAGNLRAFQTGFSNLARPLNRGTTFEGNQTFNIAPDANNSVRLDWLAYEFPYQSSKVYIAATGGLHADYAPVLNPYFYDGDGGNGSLSTFAQQSPIYRIGGGAGAGIRFGVGNTPIIGPTSVTIGYLADNANNPGRSLGLTNGDYSALGQINFNIADRIAVGATYVHGYHTSGSGIFDIGGSAGLNNGSPVVGSSLANNPASLIGATPGVNQRLGRTVSNSYGVEAAFRPVNNISISGFAMRTNARVLGRGDATIWSYGGGVALPDFGKKGNVLGLFAGVEPTLRGFKIAGASHANFRNTNSYHLEGFYKYQLTDNISVTPGIIWLTNPNQDVRNQNAVIGTLRTTFTF